MAASTRAATAGGLVLVRGQQGVTPTTPIALELETGTEVGRMPNQTGTCAGDGINLIACSVLSPEPRLYTIRSDERKIRVAGHADPKGELITLVRDDRIYYAGGDDPVQEVDRSGTPLVDHMPDGLLLALDDSTPSSGSRCTGHYQVYRVG